MYELASYGAKAQSTSEANPRAVLVRVANENQNMAQNLAYADAMAEKPASRPIAKAIRHPSGKGFAGQFALPGLVPDYVREDGRPVRYQDASAAEFAALRAMMSVLVSRTVDPRKAGGYTRMTGADLAIALDDSEITPTEFAELYGVPQSRVMGWIDGVQDVPHSAHVLIRLLAYEENFREARSITDRAQGLELRGIDDGRDQQE